MSAHPTPEELADHAEGLLGEADARALAGHLDGCAACRAVQADLDQVRALLAADRPGPMPADVAARLDAALAAAAAGAAAAASADAAAPAAAPDAAVPASVDVSAARDRRRARAGRGPAAYGQRTGRWQLRLAGAAAGLILVVGGAVLGSQVLGDGTAVSPVTSGSAERATGLAENSAPPEGVAGQPGSGVASQRGADGSGQSGGGVAGQPGPAFATASGRAYTKAGFAGQIAALLRTAGENRPAVPPRDAGGAPADVQGAAANCAVRLAAQTGQPGMSPLAVDVGTWNGEPAFVVVLPEPRLPTAVHAYVTARDCGTQPSGRVLPLHDQVVPRP